MIHTRWLAVLALLSASVAGAFETDYSMSDYGPTEEPQLFVTPSLLDLGLGAQKGLIVRLINLDAQWWRIRGGISLGEFGYGATYTTFLTMPVRAGFTIWQRPVWYTGRLYGMVPEVYVQGSASLDIWTIDGPPADLFIGHAELRGALNSYGVGIDVGVGVAAVKTRWGSSGQNETISWGVGPALDACVRLGVGNLGF